MFSESRKDRRRRIGDRAAADRLKDRDNAAGIGDNSSEIGNIPQKSAMAPQGSWYRRERDLMLNSVLNGDWSNSDPGRQIPQGTITP